MVHNLTVFCWNSPCWGREVTFYGRRRAVLLRVAAPSNPGLGPEQQAVIADDYGMVDGKLQLDVRKALALYYLRMLHLDGDGAVNDPKVNQIVLTARIQRAPSC